MSENRQTPLHCGHRERLKQSVIQNLRQASDVHLLEFLLTFAIPRRDTKPMAKELVRVFGNIRAVLDAERDEITSINGLGSHCADLWEVIRELRARYEECPVRRKLRICNNKTVAAMAKARLAGLKVEELWVVCVDSQLHLLSFEQLSRGTVDATHAYPQEVIRLCIKHHAWGFILVHNHPAGGRPSAQDVEISLKMEAAARSAGLCMLEHLVLMDDSYCGLRENGLISPLSA